MAVLVEGISVVVRRDALERKLRHGWDDFVDLVPNSTDGVLAAVSFMTPFDVGAFVSTLVERGLVFVEGEEAVDFAVVDQRTGPTGPASWLQCGILDDFSVRVAACWIQGQAPGRVAMFDGWKYEESLSYRHTFVPNKAMDDRLKPLRREGGNDVYRDLWTGDELFAGRPAIAGTSEQALMTQLAAIHTEALEIERRAQQTADEETIATLFHRLTDDLLPASLHIADGLGRGMPFAHLTAGVVLRILGRVDDAEKEFRQAHELAPKVVGPLLELVKCLGLQEKRDQALHFARKAVDVGPLDAGAWGNLAMCLIEVGEREEARRALDFALTCDADNPINRYIDENFSRYFDKA
jgi:tetratricopeptide (TPR) repeat protein